MNAYKILIANILIIGSMVVLAWPVIGGDMSEEYRMTPEKLSHINMHGRGADTWGYYDQDLHKIYSDAIFKNEKLPPHYTITATHNRQSETFIMPIAFMTLEYLGAYVQKGDTLYLYNCYRPNGVFESELVLNNVTNCVINGLN